MDWVIVLVVISFVVLTGARTVIGIWFTDSWINSGLEDIDESIAWDDDCGGGDGGD